MSLSEAFQRGIDRVPMISGVPYQFQIKDRNSGNRSIQQSAGDQMEEVRSHTEWKINKLRKIHVKEVEV
jgi:hypothetical protein